MPTRDKRLRLEQNRAKRAQEAQPARFAPPLPEKKDAMMASAPAATHWCRFVIPGQGSLTYRGTNYDYGELLTVANTPRDEQLVRLGYVYPTDPSERHLHAQCGVCEQWFLTEYYRDMHGRRRHQERFASDDLEVGGGMAGPDGGTALRDITGDAEERRLMLENPLFLDKTKASQQA